jgi:hypothetical protein
VEETATIGGVLGGRCRIVEAQPVLGPRRQPLCHARDGEPPRPCRRRAPTLRAITAMVVGDDVADLIFQTRAGYIAEQIPYHTVSRSHAGADRNGVNGV